MNRKEEEPMDVAGSGGGALENIAAHAGGMAERSVGDLRDKMQLLMRHLTAQMFMPDAQEDPETFRTLQLQLDAWSDLFTRQWKGTDPSGADAMQYFLVSEPMVKDEETTPSPKTMSAAFRDSLQESIAAFASEMPPDSPHVAQLQKRWTELAARHDAAPEMNWNEERLHAFAYGNPYDPARRELRAGVSGKILDQYIADEQTATKEAA